MDQATRDRIVPFIWGIADDVSRDLFRRGNCAVKFKRHFYKPRPLRTLEEISADILSSENKAGRQLNGHLVGALA